jgi:hypothetical protein
MTDYALKFLDEAEANLILYRKEGVIEESEGIESNAGHDVAKYQNIDILGTLYIQSGTLEEPISTALDGWHVNIRDDGDCSALEQYVVYPKNPKRIFA